MDERLNKAARFFKNSQFDHGNKLLQQLAIENNPTAHLWLAHNIRNGYGFNPSLKKAIPHYQKAAQLGEPIAQYELGMAYFNGEGVEENHDKGWKWLLKSAQQGYVEAECQVGLFYQYGYGVKKNLKAANQWFERAAKKGHTQSMRNLGFLYFSETSIKNKKKASFWFRKAVVAMAKDARNGRTYQQTIVPPQKELAFGYLEGDPLVGGKRDYKKAAQWARFLIKSKDNCDRADGYLILGQLFLNGAGCAKNISKGKRLLEAAIKEGSLEAEDLLKNLPISKK